MVSTLLNPLFQYLVVLTREGKEMKHGNNALIFSSAVVLVLSGVTSPVYAGTTESQDFDEIVSSAGLDSSQESDRTLVRQGLEKTAQERNINYDAAVSQVAQESREHIQADNISGDNGGALVPQIVSGGSDDSGHKVSMGRARHRGDVFYSSNSTIGVKHGHNGIYVSENEYVEATSPSVRRVDSESVDAPAPAYKYYVGDDKDSSEKDKAATFAEEQVGKGYNWIFFANKSVNSDNYNCSQLVWASYKNADSNIDLDADGGPGVYPKDIADSPMAHEYETRE